MKHIQIRFIYFALFAILPFLTEAQTTAKNETDSLNTSKETLVQVAYRKVAKSDLLGGVSVLNYEKLTQKNYNTYSLDNLQGYVSGWNGNSMWGMGDYLVLVDGVPRDANNVLPTEIKQITFLKGASAVVLYGSRAAKGVIYISTKRGKEEPLKVNVRANTGFHVSKSYPKYLGSAQYMTLYNEALTNDGLSPLYSDEDIYHYASGSNPYRYPSVDLYSSDYLKKAYNRSDVTTEITGGNERARFYTNIGYYYQGDVFKFGEAKNNNTNRLNIRGNVDLEISDEISAYVDANATFYNSRSANGDYWSSAASLRPNRVAPLIPLSYVDPNDLASLALLQSSHNIIDGKYFLGGTQADMTNVIADYYAAGYSKWTSRQFQFDTGINFDLGNVLKGLAFHTQFAVDYNTSFTSSYNNTYAVYEPDWYNYNGTDVIAGLTQYNNDEKSGVQNISGSSDRQTIDFSGYFTYNTSINTAHHISAILVASGFQQTQSTVYHKVSNANLGLQVSYDYRSKYFVDFGAAEIHSAKLAPGHRNAFSPSLTLGWKLSNEDFLSGSSAIDNLEISASASILNSDLDIADFYMYEANYTQANGAWWGWYDGASERSTNSKRGGNENLTFIKRKELSATIKGSFWKRLITADASFFVNSTEGLIIEPTTIFPNYFSTYYPEASFIPYVNYNNDERIGFDFNVNFNKRIGQVDFTLGVAGTYYNTKATRRDENNEFAYQNRQGQPIDGIWGLRSAGLFQSQDEIDNAPEQKFGGTVKPGDIKYIDQNGDNVIDDKDVVYLGRGGWYGAPFTMGVNLTAKWKNITLFALGTGGYGGNALKNNSYYWVYGDRKYSEVVLDRWTEATKTTAKYPRLTTESGSNNFRTSDFWLYKNNRFDLAKVQITYDLPKERLQNSLFKDISIYLSGANLLTVSKERKVLEMSVTSAPRTRFYNMGVKAVF
ncbi:SusC/RagA family TonB-linked outer membrane protein [Prolixibacter denitrificans]|uniref:SusC/RagA family TonB-linked outer membrane protein n=1 Tax=Prolixibacter denitrificans TaxID=1541063 RepID=A0A2P8CCQ2_9BACT|nr:SusC/RagA family TonB-linked outer membrane protein [Prolixibacter denitrificans]PSK82753.1 TonB-linked SusC/RagA family outer membrane protein [Prolixibacter denitrificans]GET21427.1 SusC/RagA family TonB-linked outer membrane protein [Prolixibacter denitrificans]